LNTKSLDFFSQEINILYKSVKRRSRAESLVQGTKWVDVSTDLAPHDRNRLRNVVFCSE